MGLNILCVESFDGGTAVNHFADTLFSPTAQRKIGRIWARSGSPSLVTGFTGQALKNGMTDFTFELLPGYDGHNEFVVVLRFYYDNPGSGLFDADHWLGIEFFGSINPPRNQWCEFHFRRSENGHVQFRNGTALEEHNGLLHQQSGGSPPCVTNTWQRVECRVKVADSGGAWNMYIDGTLVLDGTGDTNPSGVTDPKIRYVRISCDSKCVVDDILIADGGGSTTAYPGAIRVYARHPISDAEVDAIPTPDGVNAETVDEVGQDDADYVTFQADGDTDLYNFQDLGVSGTIHCVQLTYRTAWENGTMENAAMAKLSGVEDEGTQREAPSADPNVFGEPTTSHVFLEKPSGGTWTATDVDNATFGVRRKPVS